MPAKAAKIVILLLLLAQGSAADDWPGPRVMTVFSEGGGRFVRVTPGESLGDSVGFADQLGSIKRSVSSRWWRCSPFHFVDMHEQTKVYVRESLGGYVVFELPTGKFTYFKGTAECQPPSQR